LSNIVPNEVKGFVLTLAYDITLEHAELLRDLLSGLTGVVAVHPIPVEVGDHINRERIKYELRNELYLALEHQ
jgi:hypothetical protein